MSDGSDCNSEVAIRPDAPAPEVGQAAEARAPARGSPVAHLKLFVWAVFCAVAVFLFYWLVARGTTVGRIGGVRNAEVVSRGATRVASPRLRIVSGDTIRTVGNGRANVMFNGVDGMLLLGDSEATVSVAKGRPEGWQIEIAKGTIGFEVLSPLQGRINRILTANADIGFNSGRFEVAWSSGSTRVCVSSGDITVSQRTGGKKSLNVTSGFEAVVRDGLPLMSGHLSGDTVVEALYLSLAVEGIAVEGVDSPMRSDVVLDRNKVPGLLAVKAVTQPATVGSVKFEVVGLPPTIVNEPPYVFAGPNGEGWKPAMGDQKLVVTSYSKRDAKGKPSVPKGVLFKVKGVAYE